MHLSSGITIFSGYDPKPRYELAQGFHLQKFAYFTDTRILIYRSTLGYSDTAFLHLFQHASRKKGDQYKSLEA
jgi:hypothetical protein